MSKVAEILCNDFEAVLLLAFFSGFVSVWERHRPAANRVRTSKRALRFDMRCMNNPPCRKLWQLLAAEYMSEVHVIAILIYLHH